MTQRKTTDARPGNPAEATAELVARSMDAPEALASSIDRIAAAMQKLADSRLKWPTIVLLVSEASGVGKRDTALVLTAAMGLGNKYLKPSKTK